jgi:hypothetical protein
MKNFKEHIDDYELGFEEEIFDILGDEEYEDWGEEEEEVIVERIQRPYHSRETVDRVYRTNNKGPRSAPMQKVNPIHNTMEETSKKKVKLNKPFLTPQGPKKRSVYVRNDKGNIVKVNFGDPNMTIKKNIPARRKSFRARHGCDVNPGPKWKAKYWSCRAW